MNDIREDAVNDGARRKARRKGAAWKSGLMLTGLGAVVLGAGYLAGANAPAVQQAAAQAATPQTVAQSNAAPSNSNLQRQQAAPVVLDDETNEAEDGVVIGFDEQGNAVILRSDGSLALGGSASGSSTQQFGRRSRQFGGSSQQAPSFSGPAARSRGS